MRKTNKKKDASARTPPASRTLLLPSLRDGNIDWRSSLGRCWVALRSAFSSPRAYPWPSPARAAAESILLSASVSLALVFAAASHKQIVEALGLLELGIGVTVIYSIAIILQHPFVRIGPSAAVVIKPCPVCEIWVPLRPVTLLRNKGLGPDWAQGLLHRNEPPKSKSHSLALPPTR